MSEHEFPWMAKRIRFAGLLTITGVLLIGGSLYWNNPSSFLMVMGSGAALVVFGIIVYFLTLLGRVRA